jgi:tricarballylate dehydrogenase
VARSASACEVIVVGAGQCRLDTDGRPLPGVFASGDVIGLFHGGYPSGAGQTRNVVFSRRAAASATGQA